MRCIPAAAVYVEDSGQIKRLVLLSKREENKMGENTESSYVWRALASHGDTDAVETLQALTGFGRRNQ